MVFFFFFFFFELETTKKKKWFFLRIQLYIWAAAGQEVGTLCTRAQSFNSYLISLRKFFTDFVNI